MGNELFELAFDGGVADVFVLEDAVSVDGEGVRNGGDGKDLSDGTGEAAVAILRPSHFVFADEVFPLLFVGIQAHAKDHQRLPLAVLEEKYRHGLRPAAIQRRRRGY